MLSNIVSGVYDMSSLVSICIPTCNRPELLVQAIESCLLQTYRSIEILVGDDSSDTATETAIASYIDKIDKGELRYWHHAQAKGQADNVNFLFDHAKGDRIVLLHDDDLLLANAVEKLSACWGEDSDIIAAFGKQYLIKMDGTVLLEESESLNESYFRNKHHSGKQESALKSALLAQFPNNGFMILTSAARTVRYRNDADVSHACDFDFGIRLAQQFDVFYYIDEYIMKYRMTDMSLSKTKNYSDATYRLIEQVRVPSNLKPVVDKRLKSYAVSAVHKSLQLGDKREGLRIFLSSNYPFLSRLSATGVFHLVMMFLPVVVIKSVYAAMLKKHSVHA
jgi:glycosyltransferase involved in cell wall biosynthesis